MNKEIKHDITRLQDTIRSDNLNIKRTCLKYNNGNTSHLEDKRRASRGVRNFYLDRKAKLGWCLIPKVRDEYLFHQNSLTFFTYKFADMFTKFLVQPKNLRFYRQDRLA